jgi:ectoine hydroxylase-related dioxygenase (phytanoyl-CoA dioxygenase family)
MQRVILETLLAAGTDAHILIMKWDDVLAYAAYNGLIEIVRLLVAKGDVLAIVYHHNFYHGAI